MVGIGNTARRAVGLILFEHPFNERTRFLIRLEYLFKRLFTFAQSAKPEDQHVCFGVLFEIMELCDRGDFRAWVLQEIDKQKVNLESYRDYPEVDIAVLDDSIRRLSEVSRNLSATHKLGSHLRDNEWLMALRSRFLTPGSTSPMDMPSYGAWLNSAEPERVEAIKQLIRPFMPLYEAIAMVLKTLRDAAEPDFESTRSNGCYEKSIGGRIYQMARVWVPQGHRIYPEISGNKHVVMLRFYRLDENFRQHLIMEPVGFKMALCNI